MAVALSIQPPSVHFQLPNLILQISQRYHSCPISFQWILLSDCIIQSTCMQQRTPVTILLSAFFSCLPQLKPASVCCWHSLWWPGPSLLRYPSVSSEDPPFPDGSHPTLNYKHLPAWALFCFLLQISPKQVRDERRMLLALCWSLQDFLCGAGSERQLDICLKVCGVTCTV